jgi:nuclear pore complex protein Nup160
VPWHKILYAWRVRRGDFRGAAAVAYQQLQKLQQLANGGHGKDLALWSGKKSTGAGNDELDTPVTRQYLQLINALSCVEPGQAWILAEPVGRKNGVVEKRRVITLEDARRGLQDEMDRVEGILRGRFSFVGGEERDVDMDED